ncbi:MAG: hypothetical protein ACRD3O_02460 [Terriglobia bacterium]
MSAKRRSGSATSANSSIAARSFTQIYTNDAAALAPKLDRQVSKEVAIEIRPARVQELGKAVTQEKKQAALEQSIA